MSIGWIKAEEYSFNSFLLLERFQIRLMLENDAWTRDKAKWRKAAGLALAANPAVAWYLKRRCPECASIVDRLTTEAPKGASAQEVRAAEIAALSSVEDFTIYTTPEKMAQSCDFMRGWNKERLFGLADLSGKTALDVGAGSGRLAFAAAEKAAWVYASEPVGTLREFMRDKITKEGIANVRVLDGFVESLPFPDNTFDIVMSGHVVGDDLGKELAELERVCKPGGWLLNVPGDSENDLPSQPELIRRGWEELHYVGSFGKNVFIHRKRKT